SPTTTARCHSGTGTRSLKPPLLASERKGSSLASAGSGGSGPLQPISVGGFKDDTSVPPTESTNSSLEGKVACGQAARATLPDGSLSNSAAGRPSYTPQSPEAAITVMP